MKGHHPQYLPGTLTYLPGLTASMSTTRLFCFLLQSPKTTSSTQLEKCCGCKASVMGNASGCPCPCSSFLRAAHCSFLLLSVAWGEGIRKPEPRFTTGAPAHGTQSCRGIPRGLSQGPASSKPPIGSVNQPDTLVAAGTAAEQPTR